MQYLPNSYRAALKHLRGALRGKSADANDPFGLRAATTARRCRSQAVNNASFSDAASLSGVRLRPPLSRKARGQ